MWKRENIEKNIFISENVRQFWIQDNNFYSLLENTKWLKYISYCLQKTVEVCDHLSLGISVILQGNCWDIIYGESHYGEVKNIIFMKFYVWKEKVDSWSKFLFDFYQVNLCVINRNRFVFRRCRKRLVLHYIEFSATIVGSSFSYYRRFSVVITKRMGRRWPSVLR